MEAKNLSYRLSIYFLISAIIISGFIFLFGYYYVRDLIFRSNQYRLQFEVREVLDDMENSLDNSSTFVKQLALDFNREDLQHDPARFMRLIFDGQPDTYSIGIVKSVAVKPSIPNSIITLQRSGNTIKVFTGEYFTANNKTNDWVNLMICQSNPEWSAPFYDTKIGARLMIYAYPFNYSSKGKKLYATLFCSVNLDNHLKELNKQKMIKSGFAMLLNENQQIVYYPDSFKTGHKVASQIDYLGSKFDVGKAVSDHISGYQLITNKNSKKRREVIIYWPVRSSNWFMILAIPESLFISDVKRLVLFLIPVLLFIGSVVAALTIYKSYKLVSPISSLANDSRQIVEGDAFNRFKEANDPKILSDSDLNWNYSRKQTIFPTNDIHALAFYLEKIKDRLANYQESYIQSSLDKIEIEKELMLAKDIEMGMVPTKFPLVSGRKDFDCYGRLIPAKIVGGDLFDLFLLDNTHLFISITDTVGKGIPAAMYSVMTRTFIRSIANPITRLGKMMESLNDALGLLHESDMFASVILGKLDLRTGEFIYCNAGHPYPFVLRNDDSEEALVQSQGIPVGIKRNIAYSESSVKLASGESLIMFTDGMTEQNDENGILFSIERLMETVKPFRKNSTQTIVNKAIDSLLKYQGKAEVHDDITLVAVKFTG